MKVLPWTEVFTYSIGDGNGGNCTAVITLGITNVNEAPVLAVIGDQAAQVGNTFNFTVTATDPDPTYTLSYLLGTGAPTGASLDSNTGLIVGRPTASKVVLFSQKQSVIYDGSPVPQDSKTL